MAKSKKDKIFSGIGELQPGELYLKKCIELANYPKAYKRQMVILIISILVFIGGLVMNFISAEQSALKIVGIILATIGGLMSLIFLISTLKTAGPAKDIKKTNIYKKLNKRMNFRSEDDFYKIDEMISQDIINNTIYKYPRNNFGFGSIITNNFIILNAYGIEPDIYEASKALLFTGYTYTISNRYSSSTYYTIKLYTSDEYATVNVGSEIIQQEEGMNMAIAARVLFAPNDAGFQAMFKKKREEFIADATRERRILYSNVDGIAEAIANMEQNVSNGFPKEEEVEDDGKGLKLKANFDFPPPTNESILPKE